MRRLLICDLLCYGAMACVAVGVTLNIAFLQVLNSDGPSRLVLIPVAVGLVVPLLVAIARETRFLEAVAAGASLYLLGSGLLVLGLNASPQLRALA